MADEPRFVVDGVEYPFPDPNTLTMGEALVLEREYGVRLDELGSRLTLAMAAGLFHAAIIRKNPAMSHAEARKMVEAANLVAVLEAFGGDEDEGTDAGPPDLSGSGSSSTSGSGRDSLNGSDSSPAAAQSPTGGLRSVTSRTSGPATSST